MKRSRLTQHLIPFFADRPLSKIASFDLERYKHQRSTKLQYAEEANNDPKIASAVETWTQIERNVHIDRKLARDRVTIGLASHLAQRTLIEVHRELRRSRIGGVSRAGPVVAAQQARVDVLCLEHAHELAAIRSGRAMTQINRRRANLGVRVRK